MHKHILFLMMLAAGPALAQQCALSFTLTSAASSGVFNNLTRGCTDWTVTFNSTGFTGLTFTVQTAPNNSGSPGAWSTFTPATGSNPSTATTQASATFSGYFPFVRVTLSGLTGSGTVTGLLYGTWTAAGGSSSAGCPDPCPVEGVNAAGTPSTAPPVQVAGNDGTNVRAIRTNASGDTQAVGPGASGAALSGAPVRVGLSDTTNTQNWLTASSLADAGTAAGAGAVGMVLFNGTNWDRWRGTTNGGFVQGPIATGTALAGNPVRIGGSDGTNVRNALMDASGGFRLASVSFGFGDGASNTFNGLVGTNNASNPIGMANFNMVYSPVNDWNRQRGSTAGTLIAGRGNDSGGVAIFYSASACDQQAAVTIAAGATTQVVALTAAQSIRVCSLAVTGDTAAGTFKFVQGTGANCGTGTADISGTFNVGVATNIAYGSGLGELFKTTAANALCITTVTSALNGLLSYTKY